MATVTLLQNILSRDLVTKKYILDIDTMNTAQLFLTEELRGKYSELAQSLHTSSMAALEVLLDELFAMTPLPAFREYLLAFAAGHPYLSIQDVFEVFNAHLEVTNLTEYEKDSVLNEAFAVPEKADYSGLIDELKKLKGLYDNYTKSLFDSNNARADSNVAIVSPLDTYNEVQRSKLAEIPKPFDWSKTIRITLGDLFGLGASLLAPLANPPSWDFSQAAVIDKMAQSVQKAIVILQNYLYQSLGKNETKITEYQDILDKYSLESSIEIEINTKKYNDEMLRYENTARVTQETQIALYNAKIDELYLIVPPPMEEIASLSAARDLYISTSDAEIEARLLELETQKQGYIIQAEYNRTEMIFKLEATLTSYKQYIQYDVVQSMAGVFSFAQVILVILASLMAIYEIYRLIMESIQTFYPYYSLIVKTIGVWANPALAQEVVMDLTMMGVDIVQKFIVQGMGAFATAVSGLEVEMPEQVITNIRAISGLANVK